MTLTEQQKRMNTDPKFIEEKINLERRRLESIIADKDRPDEVKEPLIAAQLAKIRGMIRKSAEVKQQQLPL